MLISINVSIIQAFICSLYNENRIFFYQLLRGGKTEAL